MKNKVRFSLISIFIFLSFSIFAKNGNQTIGNRPRVIVLTDAEIDDQCSLVRFLLYSNEWDVEGIISTSSQYHWHGHKWAGDDWAMPYLDAYKKVYPNLIKHDKSYPSPKYLKSVTVLGNVKSEGEMDDITDGSKIIVKAILDESDKRPIWFQAWGGTNTLARALKTIEENYPDKMQEVADKLRFFFIWEQDNTYQSYILPHWGKYNIPTIISDQFWALAYQWDKIIPEDKIDYFRSDWMSSHILNNHGALCSLYQAYKGGGDKEGFKAGDPKSKGDFRSEGDSPSFIYSINTGLRSMESPDYGGWGGRYVKVRANTWLDKVPEEGYKYPEGRWYTANAWGRQYMKLTYPDKPELMKAYFDPITRWMDALQNDFASRADWCVKSYKDANHAPIVMVSGKLDRTIAKGKRCVLDAKKSSDPDNDKLSFKWWFYKDSSSYDGDIEIANQNTATSYFTVPTDAKSGDKIHMICEVKDNGTPSLTRYCRVIISVK